ncbi:MAG: hypothetical protein JEZ07_09035 [Phycisphaerae bacterium]|nr:hypothetical protein [Phycisphaerae bacterium]
MKISASTKRAVDLLLPVGLFAGGVATLGCSLRADGCGRKIIEHGQ